MEKIICDFCKKNEATSYYRIQQQIEVPQWELGMVLPKPAWVKRDICKECYDKLFKGDKNGIR